jgi:predicted MFS family arabinose efflux permease
MLSHAGREAGGVGWAFGINEALDQTGAMMGPLTVAAVLAFRHDYHLAFAVLAVPAAITIALVILARVLYPRPQDLDRSAYGADVERHPSRVLWIYLAGAAFAAAGLADFPLIAFHFARAQVVPSTWIAAFYAVAMATSGAGSLLFGRLFDRFGFRVLIGLTFIAALFAPLVFLGGFWPALLGVAIWGLAAGVFESIIPAAITPMVPPDRRASSFGLFTAVYGLAWFAGSALIGFLYDRSIPAVIGFCVVSELLAAPFFLRAARLVGRRKPNGDLA